MAEEPIRTFEDLRCWQAGREVRLHVARFVRQLPPAERYRLGDQMLRSARSVTANIAEGYGRFHYQENAQFCRQARGSLYELLDHFICASDEGLATEDELREARSLVDTALRILNGYINYLRDARDRSRKVKETDAEYAVPEQSDESTHNRMPAPDS